MPVVAIVPIRSFRSGKARLADSLSASLRERLGLAMAGHTVAMARAAGANPVVVTGSSEVADWADTGQTAVVGEDGDGLDAAARSGVRWALDRGSTWMVLHSDLPMLAAADLDPLVAMAAEGICAIAPSADGGTSCLTAPGEFDFSYGPASARRHLGRLDEARVVVRTGLLHDVDSPDDLRSALSHPAGAWMRAVVDTGIDPSPGG